MKTFKTFKLIFLFLFLLTTGIGLAQDRETLKKENAIIDQRAKEIEAYLTEEPSVFGAPWSDRAAWEKIAQLPGKGNLVKIAEKLIRKPIEDNSEDLYKEFYKNGNRSHYQKALGLWTGRLSTLALAEGIEHKGRFIPALEELIRKFCAYPSWVLPAHDREGEIFDGKVVYSDLVSTALGQEFGIILSWAQKDLSPEVVELLKKNIEVRVLEPYRICVKEGTKAGKRSMWWIRGANNWNSVCHAGTVGAALTTVSSKADRAWFIAATEYCTEHYFFAGFTSDGYCSEGMGYWNYGFGNFVYLASAIRQATGGKVDLFKNPMVVKCTNFAPGMEIAGRKYAAFADCSIKASPSPVYMNYLSRTCGLNLDFYEKIGTPQNVSYGVTELAFFLADPFLNAGKSASNTEKSALNTEKLALNDKKLIQNDKKLASGANSQTASKVENSASDKEQKENELVNAPIRTDFDVAGVLICRPDPGNKKKTLAVAMKGGHNSELHNHNDIGSYSLALVTYDEKGDQKADYMVLDPGGEIYTRRTFSKDRYVGQLLNSFGHPVPLVDGHLQKTGASARAVILEKVFDRQKDQFTIDMTSAYSYPGVKSVVRSFTYYRNDSPEILQKIRQSGIEQREKTSDDQEKTSIEFGRNAVGALVIEDRIELDPQESTQNSVLENTFSSEEKTAKNLKVEKIGKIEKTGKIGDKSKMPKESKTTKKSKIVKTDKLIKSDKVTKTNKTNKTGKADNSAKAMKMARALPDVEKSFPIGGASVTRPFESALITFAKASVKKQGDSFVIRIGQKDNIRVFVAVFDENGVKVPASFAEQLVGENDDSVPNKPVRLSFGPENSLRKGIIRFIFLP